MEGSDSEGLRKPTVMLGEEEAIRNIFEPTIWLLGPSQGNVVVRRAHIDELLKVGMNAAAKQVMGACRSRGICRRRDFVGSKTSPQLVLVRFCKDRMCHDCVLCRVDESQREMSEIPEW